jgi:hypothetical protein
MAKCQNVTIEGVNVPQSYYKAYGTTCRRQKQQTATLETLSLGLNCRTTDESPGTQKSIIKMP